MRPHHLPVALGLLVSLLLALPDAHGCEPPPPDAVSKLSKKEREAVDTFVLCSQERLDELTRLYESLPEQGTSEESELATLTLRMIEDQQKLCSMIQKVDRSVDPPALVAPEGLETWLKTSVDLWRWLHVQGQQQWEILVGIAESRRELLEEDLPDIERVDASLDSLAEELIEELEGQLKGLREFRTLNPLIPYKLGLEASWGTSEQQDLLRRLLMAHDGEARRFEMAKGRDNLPSPEVFFAWAFTTQAVATFRESCVKHIEKLYEKYVGAFDEVKEKHRYVLLDENGEPLDKRVKQLLKEFEELKK